MRIGSNPAKSSADSTKSKDYFHQIIIPVYLPQLEDYFEEGLKIFKICLESINLTIHKNTFITVVNNGSCKEVELYLNQCKENKIINEIIHTEEIGKVNAIAKGLSGHNFDLVTITDADVLFKPNWQEKVYKVFKVFPKAGIVGTTPNSKMLKYLTEIVHYDNIFNPDFKFRPVLNPKAMMEFAKSIGNNSLFKKIHLNYALTIKKDNTIAVVGTGHFTATYKPRLLEGLKKYYSKEKLGPTSDKKAIDIPSIKYGHWRLCTYQNYTFHLGNQTEQWMYESLKDIKKNQYSESIKPEFRDIKRSMFTKKKQQIFRKVFFNKIVQKYYFKYLGLKSNQAINY